jgi:hypothetical protein
MKLLKIAVGTVIVRSRTVKVKHPQPLGPSASLPKYDKPKSVATKQTYVVFGDCVADHLAGGAQLLPNCAISCILVLRPLGRKQFNGYVN